MKIRQLMIIVILALLVALSGCKSSDDSSDLGDMTGKAIKDVKDTDKKEEPKTVDKEDIVKEVVVKKKTHTIEVFQRKFSPDTITINAGDTIKWEVVEGVHIIDDYDSNAFTSQRLTEGQDYEFTFNEEGEYEIIDQVLRFKGLVIVE